MKWLLKNEERIFLALAVILGCLLLIVCVKTVEQGQKQLDLIRALLTKCEGLE